MKLNNMIQPHEFKIPRMGTLVNAIKLDLYDAIDRVLIEQSYYVIASDFDDPVNHILVEIEHVHYKDSPEESFVATVSPDNISVFFLSREFLSSADLAIHLHMTPDEFLEYAPTGFIFVASKGFQEKFDEYFDDDSIHQVSGSRSSNSVH